MKAVLIGSAFAFCIVLANSSAARGAGTEYLLGSGDKLRIKVTEWRPARGQVYEWDAASGEFTVSTNGAISVPLLGEVEAAGFSTEQLSKAISNRLQNRVNAIQKLETSVEIIQYRPFYILGAINKPGEYNYRPHLSLVQAVGIAGGLLRFADLRLHRESVSASGELRIALVEQKALMVRRARLEAEQRGDVSLTFPPDILKLKTDPSTAKFIEQETSIFVTRRENIRSQVEALQQGKQLLQAELASLREKIQVQERQRVLANKESEAINNLVNKGLAVSSRQFQTEQQVAQIESTRLDLVTAVLRAQQEISRSDRDIMELRNKRKESVSLEIKESEVKIQGLTQRAETARALLAETQMTTESKYASSYFTRYNLVRRIGGELKESEASEYSTLEPGDVVRVEFVLQDEKEDSSPLASPTQSALTDKGRRVSRPQ